MIMSLLHGMSMCTGREGCATSPPTIGVNTHATNTAVRKFGHAGMEEEQRLNKSFNQQRDLRRCSYVM